MEGIRWASERATHKGVLAMGEISKVALKRLVGILFCDKGKQFAAAMLCGGVDVWSHTHPPARCGKLLKTGRETCARDRKYYLIFNSKCQREAQSEIIFLSSQEIRQIASLIKTFVLNWMPFASNAFDDYFRLWGPHMITKAFPKAKLFLWKLS
jgi:hypothetical protein